MPRTGTRRVGTVPDTRCRRRPWDCVSRPEGRRAVSGFPRPAGRKDRVEAVSDFARSRGVSSSLFRWPERAARRPGKSKENKTVGSWLQNGADVGERRRREVPKEQQMVASDRRDYKWVSSCHDDRVSQKTIPKNEKAREIVEGRKNARRGKDRRKGRAKTKIPVFWACVFRARREM